MKLAQNVAIGFYQNRKVADQVLNNLKKEGLKRSGYIHRDHYGQISVRGQPKGILQLYSFFVITVPLLLILLFIQVPPLKIFTLFALLVMGTIAWYLHDYYLYSINSSVLNKFKKLVISDETLVLVQIDPEDVPKALSILRHVKSGHPTSFLLRAEMLERSQKPDLVREPLTIDALIEQARKAAIDFKEVSYVKSSKPHLLNGLRQCENSLNEIKYILAEAEIVEQTITLSAEWLLDNAYVIQGNIDEIKRNLPEKYYRSLPNLIEGPLAGLPRVYGIAKDIIRCSANRLSRENIVAYLDSYQTIDQLTIGELWVLPLMLRLRLIECLNDLALDIDRRLREGERALLWGNRLLNVSRREPERLNDFLENLEEEEKHPSAHFAEELIDHLYDEDKIIPPVKKWLEARLKNDISEVIKMEQLQKTAEQIALSNAIVSLITLSQLSWREIFELISSIDKILGRDPIGIYSSMDFNSRDSYRHAIEVLAKGSKYREGEVASLALQMAESGKDTVTSHVGYYLVDHGRESLESAIGYKPTWSRYIRRKIIENSTAVYVSSIVLGVVVIELLLAILLYKWDVGLVQSLLFLLFSLLPASELSVQWITLFITKILQPIILPKLAYENGIPEDLKTLVVVPSLLTTEEDITENISRLEVHYLANLDNSLKFGIFFDSIDAPKQHMPNDQVLLNTAIKGMQALEEKYGEGTFFLFYRDRIWSSSENSWIGRERKRGKLECLNSFLIDQTCPEMILKVGNKDFLKGVRYVITLDADTSLPKDTARQLIETISHPLNAPQVRSGKVVRGYTIIQPRVGTDVAHARNTFFAKIFSDVQSSNPYTQAVSDIYQDLASEGNYHGKGIYDLYSFHIILSKCFPEEHLLSHDLVEGVHVRVGYASDIVLTDFFPQDYYAWSKRQHRWIRGDWQIIDWLLPKVPCPGGKKTSNPLSLISRWKIFDNLRRSLMPIAFIYLLVFAFLTSPSALFWASFVFFVFITPTLCMALFSSFVSIRGLVLTWKDLIHLALRALVNIALLPHQAYISADAILRVIFRRSISHKKLLEWEKFYPVSTGILHRHFIIKLFSVSLFAVGVFVATILLNPLAIYAAIPYCFLWLFAPGIISFLDKRRVIVLAELLSDDERLFLRRAARNTWRYFDDFVGPQTHWLPPDNFQAALNIEVAQRTSPTNIGLWMLAVLAANDFKYINTDEVIKRLSETFLSFKKLEMYEGHFLNWYDIQTLKPLYPRYVSTVDSGNLLACFWTLEQGIYQITNNTLLPSSIIEGLKDTFNFARESLPERKATLQPLQALLAKSYKNSSELSDFINQSLDILQEFFKSEKIDEASFYWLKQYEEELYGWKTILNRYYPWVQILKELKEAQLSAIHPQANSWRKQIFEGKISLKMLAATEIPEVLTLFLTTLEKKVLEDSALKTLHHNLKAAINNAQWFAGEKLNEMNAVVSDINRLCDGLNMRFLYNKERKLFSIGYHIDNCCLDNSYYDLLASEARIASFVAIAKNDVPLDHWWALGRPFGYLYGRHVLMSWGGTMFEYLMPLLFKNLYPDTLMANACRNALDCQIIYAEKRGIPWGISEAAFSAIDSHRIYQYRSFGVPGLGFKRNLEDDLVVSPYSTALALAIDPKKAIRNFKRLGKEYHLFEAYGYYESIDFTRQRAPRGERGVVVYAYMAHHQGMSLLSFNNILNDNIIRKRFHANPRICGMEALLSERAPVFPPIAKGSRKTIPISRLAPFPAVPIMGLVETPQSSAPKVNLLSNGTYSVMMTNSGGGYSAWKDFEITRWRSDVTADNWGSFFYIKDVKTNYFWSAAFHPTCKKSKRYSVSFKADRTEFSRLDNQIETHMEIVVSPEDDAEIRLLTLANLSNQIREIEITSYSEIVLATHATDAAHPAFNKLFIETEALSELPGLLAFRRLRSADDNPLVAGQVVASNEPSTQPVQFETDRELFIGRGNTLQSPAAMHDHLSRSQGYVLDPIFSLRYRISLKPGQRTEISFVTVVSTKKEKTLALIKKYSDLTSSHRAIEMAWAHAQLELRHLHIHQEEAQLFQKLASRVLYPHAQLRPAPERLMRNKLGQPRLWAYGISGDLPIIAVSITDIHELDLIRHVIIAHVFWRLRGLKTDLIILNDETTGYEHPLFEQLQRIIQSFSSIIDIEKSGGVFLLNSDQIPEEDSLLILAVARVHLIAARGSLRQQLVTPMEPTTYPPNLVRDPKAREVPSPPLPFVELKFFNEFGGFSPDGREYMIYLKENVHTPAPWINVIANPNFGCLVSEKGLGTSWFGNSQTNRLTPWSNDPVENPCSDIVYIRDEDLGTFWTPTPGPIRELDPYRIRHGQGYTRFEHNSHGIEQDLMIFVPVDDQGGMPVRVQRLRLKNSSAKKRNLSVYSYAEWVLGVDREKTQMHVQTFWDPESQSLFALNRYNPEYGNYIAFSCSIPLTASYTCNRTEFLGRNGHAMYPAALKRKKLAGLTGAAFDPCAALQVNVELEPNEEKEIIFLLGYAVDEESARELIIACKEKEWAQQTYLKTISWWDKCLGTLEVETPDILINFAFNRWLLYQTLSCRFWGRTAFYQSSGAYGFRDQLQDALALVYSLPHLAREQIIKAASRQFVEGDVQHWWHPPSNGGVRTRISDDLLWLPFVTAQYVRVTHDKSILDEEIPFIKGELLKEDQHEAYFVPEISEEKASLLEHCRRALKKGLTEGPHGLPLIGGGDWNDGMNRVGIHGKGESVWLAWFLIHVMKDFADLLAWNGQPGSDEGFRAQANRLADIVEETAWNGEWYLRAYFDDGKPLGSKENIEDKIDSLPQSWAVISGAGNPQRIKNALKAVEDHLIKNKEKLVLLLSPPFDKTPMDPGYIKGYPPGVRENGAQYTHGSLWVPLAFSRLNDGDKAIHLLKMMHPLSHSSNKNDALHFKVEPYVLAADIYAMEGKVGRGGWTWYTGSPAWMYRILLEEILGFKLRGEKLILQPVLPKEWTKVVFRYYYHSTRYDIEIENVPSSEKRNITVEVDGSLQTREELSLVNDGKVHYIKVQVK